MWTIEFLTDLPCTLHAGRGAENFIPFFEFERAAVAKVLNPLTNLLHAHIFQSECLIGATQLSVGILPPRYSDSRGGSNLWGILNISGLYIWMSIGSHGNADVNLWVAFCKWNQVGIKP